MDMNILDGAGKMDTNPPSETDKEVDNVPVNLQQFQQAIFPMGYQQYSRSQQHLSQPMNLFGNFHGNYNPYYSQQQTTTTSNRPSSAPPILPPMTSERMDGGAGSSAGVPSPSEESINNNNESSSSNNKKKKATSKKKTTKTATTKPTKGKGKGGGHANKFTVAEDKCLLEAMERYKPIGNINWTSTINYYNQTRPHGRPQRDQASIARRFNILHQTKAPTGDPNIRETIREAIRIQAAIVSKAELKSMNGVMSSDEDEFENPFVNEDDDEENHQYDDKNNEDDDSEEEEESDDINKTTKTPSRRRTTPKQRVTKRKTSSSKDTPSFSAKKKGGIADVLEFLVTQEQLHSKREKRHEKLMEKKEKLKAKRDDRKMKMLLGILGKGINTFAKRKEDKVNIEAILLDSSSSSSGMESSDDSEDDEEYSSLSDRDSPPTKRRKLKQSKKKGGPKTTGEEDE